MQPELEQRASLLKAAWRVLFITRAGVSAESGVPTFRGVTGAFANGLTEERIPFPYVIWPIALAARRGIPTVERNPQETPISDLVRYRLAAKAGAPLHEILEKMAG
jgi:NAD-dependent SIR2 family protein deacetylase